MNITEISPTIAEIAVAIAGFSALIVVLRKNPIREWHAFDQLNLRMLFQVAAVTIIFSIFPFGALVILDPHAAWRVSIFAYGLVHLLDVASFLRSYPGVLKPLHRVAAGIGILLSVFKLGFGLLASIDAIQVLYLTTLIWHLVVSGIGFASLLYLPGEGNVD